jgi:hypothetical protein
MHEGNVYEMDKMDSTPSNYNKQVLTNTRTIASMGACHVRYYLKPIYKRLAPNVLSWVLSSRMPTEAAFGWLLWRVFAFAFWLGNAMGCEEKTIKVILAQQTKTYRRLYSETQNMKGQLKSWFDVCKQVQMGHTLWPPAMGKTRTDAIAPELPGGLRISITKGCKNG